MAYTTTKDGKIEAPDWYKNDDGSTPSTMQAGLTKEKWEAQNASVKREKEKEESRQEAKERASAHLSSGGTRSDEEYKKITQETGINSHEIQKMQRADQVAKAEQNKAARQEEANAKMQYHRDKKEAGAVGPGAIGVNLRGEMESQFNETGRYHKDEYTNDVISRLMGTGQKFAQLDIEREKGSNSTHDLNGLYGKMGAQEYRDNYSVGSGNFTGAYGQDEYMERDEAYATREKAQQAKYDFYNNDLVNQNYGKYDWFQTNKSNNSQ